MSRWTELKVYKNLPPNEIPKAFKTLTKHIVNGLAKYGFRLKESKTQKKIYRITEDFEQGIFLQNTAREKNRNYFDIYLMLNPLYSIDFQVDYLLEQLWRMDKDFKMNYPISQEFELLAEHLLELFERKVVPFFDEFSTTRQVVSGYEKLPLDIPFFGLKLIYESAFRERDEALFLEYNQKLIDPIQSTIDHQPHLDTSGLSAKIAKILKEREIFLNEELYAAEILRQNEHKDLFLSQLKEKK